MQRSVASWRTRVQRSLLAAGLIAGLVSAGAPAASPATAAPPAAPDSANQLTGHVLLPGGSAAADARVVARSDPNHQATTVDASGAYTLSLASGAWQVNVEAPPPSTTSPDWVNTGDPQPVNFSGGGSSQVLDFTVMTASATITGNVVDPFGGNNFSAPNRVWVRAENQEGQGNTVQVDPATGAFSVNVLTGTVMLRLAIENPDWADPPTLAGSAWFVDVGVIQPGPVGTLHLAEKRDRIAGSVHDENDLPVTGQPIPVRAWRLDGSEFVETSTNPLDGSFELPVITGTWEVRAVPPLTSPYVTAQSPLTVIFPTDNLTRAVLLKVATADVTINGSIVDSSNPSVTLPIEHGRAFAQYRDGAGLWPQLGPTVPINNGLFTLKLSTHVAHVYRLRAYLPPDTGYTIDAAPVVTVTSGGVFSYSIPAAPDNASISGHFDSHSTGLPQLGLPGIVAGASDAGAWTFDRLNPLTGAYSLAVASTVNHGNGGTYWRVHAFVDPTTGYEVQHPRFQRVFIPAAGGNPTVDFTVAALNAVIVGRVTDPQNHGVAGARVSAREVNPPAGDDAGFDRWTLSGPLGFYAMRVTAGSYEVRAEPSPDQADNGLVASIPQPATAAAGGLAHANLSLRRRNATLTGAVSYNGAPHAAFIRAYSNNGASAFGLTTSGHYALHVVAGDVWHVQAVSEEPILSGTVTVTTFLKSPPVIITPSLGLNTGVDLAMAQSTTLPESLAFAFDASQDQDLTLSDGSEVIIPGGALADSGQVELVVRALPELADSGDAQPVSFGYRLQAFDASHIPISHFNSDVTLAIPFTAAQLTALGVTPDQLVPSYWDVATGSWKPVANVSVETQPSGDGTVFITVDHFTDFALTTSPATYLTFLPAVTR